ncbi:hypothetical protein [Burkholderia sp. BCC0405]|uniref:hypothetical protein n=1 Tax=Burkholderia sp. BCC0405 TaxID=2676298 RepID=UPI00158A4ACE|nr:hypothetical protein [Burkholderia sp. BCC0405]
MNKTLTSLAHEIYAAAQTTPGEGIADAAGRIEALLAAQQPEPRAFLTDDQRDKIEQAEACLRNTGHKEDREAANGLLDVLIAHPVQPEPRAEVTEAEISAAARVLSDSNADLCYVDRDDNWKIHGDEFRLEAKAALEAAYAARAGEGQ